MKQPLVTSSRTKKGILDDDYTLFDNGDVLHEYDKSPYPDQYNLSNLLKVDDLSDEIKERLLSDSSEENREQVRSILGM